MQLGHGEDANGGRDRSTNLAAIFEALVGAVLLDQGESTARALILKLFSSKIDALFFTKTFNDDKSSLQEFLQKHKLPLPSYVVISSKGPSHAKLFKVQVMVNDVPVAEAEASKKNAAEQEAAKAAMLVLQDQNHDFRPYWR